MNALAPIGHNCPPTDTLEDVQSKHDDLFAEVANWLDGAPARSRAGSCRAARHRSGRSRCMALPCCAAANGTTSPKPRASPAQQKRKDETMSKIDPMKLADQFLALDADDFRMFWAMVAMAWNDEDGDIDAGWFYFGQKMRPTDLTVIGALHSAVASGVKHGKGRP